MTDQQNHLTQLIEQQQALVNDINTLNAQVTSKRDLLLKVQGVIEYLEQTGTTLPDATEEVVEEKKEDESEESPKKQ